VALDTSGPLLDIGVVFVAPDAVEGRGGGEDHEKGSKGGEVVWWCRWDVVERVSGYACRVFVGMEVTSDE
jgi:hypothetical protein